jgi:hypothetical protein
MADGGGQFWANPFPIKKKHDRKKMIGTVTFVGLGNQCVKDNFIEIFFEKTSFCLKSLAFAEGAVISFGMNFY